VSERKVDALVIGSGAGGSVMAYELARRGLKVVVLERGVRQDPQTFEHNEAAMVPRVYKDGGLQMTDDHNLVIAQGCSVGGSTVINNAIWLRPDLDRVLPTWEAAGAHVPRERLVEAYEILEKMLHVSPVPPNLANHGTGVFLRGCRALGIPAEYLHNNRDTCIACGWCNYGCKYNRKTSMLVTFVPWAEGRGVEFLDRCSEVEIVSDGTLARGARFVRNQEPQTIRADRVVVCAGTIGSSTVLLRSGITVDGRVGVGLHVLGGVFVSAETNEVLDGFDGIGLTAVAHAGEDYVIESYFAPPAVFSISLGGWFLSHFHRMARYRHFAQAGVMVATDPVGRVWLDKDQRTHIDLTISNQNLAQLCKGLDVLARIFFAGGAIKVLPATFNLIEFSSPEDIALTMESIREPDDLLVGSAHPQGGNPMCEDPTRGVVGNDFRVHGFENLFVADASVFPANIHANCQATVMAMSHYAASFVAS
jgi:choline dehydrogenase-like flavoprotein